MSRYESPRTTLGVLGEDPFILTHICQMRHCRQCLPTSAGDEALANKEGIDASVDGNLYIFQKWTKCIASVANERPAGRLVQGSVD